VTDMENPLEGVTVLEMGALVAAPYCGMLLADMGATVIKLEPPEGDMARYFAPFLEEESAFFLSVNRGKRSVQLDLKDSADRECARTIASQADVVLHNFRSGVVDRLGLSYGDLSPLNQGLVYCGISGFGPTGPMATRPGIDLLFQAESGMLAITGTQAGPPVKVGTNAADVYAATTAAFAISSALVQRASSGRGTEIHVSLRDAFLALQACWFTSYLATGLQPSRLGSGSPFTAPTDVYHAQDGEIVLAVVNDKHWRIFCEALELPDLVDDPRLSTNASRVEHADFLRDRVNAALNSRTVTDWQEILDRAGIPVGRVLTYDDVSRDEQIKHNEMIVELEHERLGAIRVQGSPLWLAGRKQMTHIPPPTLGQDTAEVLRDFGCSRRATQDAE
jgi:CoA:oxalate CoA-transferase